MDPNHVEMVMSRLRELEQYGDGIRREIDRLRTTLKHIDDKIDQIKERCHHAYDIIYPGFDLHGNSGWPKCRWCGEEQDPDKVPENGYWLEQFPYVISSDELVMISDYMYDDNIVNDLLREGPEAWDFDNFELPQGAIVDPMEEDFFRQLEALGLNLLEEVDRFDG